MAEVGGIEYQVTADVAPLLRSERQVDSATGKMERSFESTEQAVAGLDTRMKTLPAAVNKANSSMNSMRGVIGNLGFQLQDIAVQAQAGTNAFTILGQQGSQVASAFGPGGAVLGAVIAIGAALAGVFAASASEAAEEIDDLSLSVEDLIDRIGGLTRAQAAYLQVALTPKITALKDELNALENEAESLRGTLQAPIRDIDFLDRTNERLLEVNSLIDTARQKIDEYGRAIQGAKDNNEDWNDSTDKTVENLDKVIERLELEAATIGKTDRQKALYVAATQGATEAQVADINAAYDRIEAYEQEQDQLKMVARLRREAAQKVQAQERTDTSTIDQLRQQLATEEELVAQSYEKRMAAIKRMTEAGSKERLELEVGAERLKNEQLLEIQRQQIENQRQLEQQAREERRQLELEELQQRLNVNAETAARLQELSDQGANAIQTLSSEWTNAVVNIGDQFASTFASAIVQGENLRDTIRGVAQSFLTDMLASLIKVGARVLINNTLASTAQATQAATAAATGAAIASAYAPAAALVSLATLGANAAPAIAGITATTAVAQGSAAIPGLALGGNVEPGGVRRINEQGPEPVIFRDGARTFMQAGSNGAQVVSNSDAQKGGMPNLNVNFNVENKAGGAQFEVQSVDQSQTELTINAIISDINNRGPVFRAFERNSNLTGTTGNG